jgi:hypothetical protein
MKCGGLEGVLRGEVRGAGVGRLLNCVKFSSMRESCSQTCNFRSRDKSTPTNYHEV